MLRGVRFESIETTEIACKVKRRNVCKKTFDAVGRNLRQNIHQFSHGVASVNDVLDNNHLFTSQTWQIVTTDYFDFVGGPFIWKIFEIFLIMNQR